MVELGQRASQMLGPSRQLLHQLRVALPPQQPEVVIETLLHGGQLRPQPRIPALSTHHPPMFLHLHNGLLHALQQLAQPHLTLQMPAGELDHQRLSTLHPAEFSRDRRNSWPPALPPEPKDILPSIRLEPLHKLDRQELSRGLSVFSKNSEPVDEVEFIQRILCRLNLPDQEVYPALARIRDARRQTDKPETHKALLQLALVFTTAVREGLDRPPTGWNLWQLLGHQRDLRSDPEMRDLLDYLVAYRAYRDSWTPPAAPPDNEGLGKGARRKPPPPRSGWGNEQQPPNL